ncbi:MAG: EutN/CcmL family microcompartment protein [Candidatus Tritonobacter lacicola]|nr:EutN/CcmL family microcompartment protein [Candidatus Tritonobacter lacicola]
MFIGKVIGTVVSTLKHEIYNGRKLLLVKKLDPTFKPLKDSLIAIDTIQAGVGDIVLINDEGNSARQILNEENGCIRSLIVGYIDSVDLAE